MCSMKFLKVYIVFLLIALIVLVNSTNALKKSTTASATISDKSAEEILNAAVNEASDKFHNVYPSSHTSLSSSGYYPQYANWDNFYYKYNPQRAVESSYYSPRLGKYSPIPMDSPYPPMDSPPFMNDYPDKGGPGPMHPDYVSVDTPSTDIMYMASSHGGGNGYGHNQGHGWGWGKGKEPHAKTITNYKVSAVNTDAIGLLGLLGLLSILQAVLLALTTTTAAGRKRRDVNGNEIDPQTEMVNHVSKLLLPSFNVIAYAQFKKLPLNCTHHEVCRANSLLVNQIGGVGVDAAEKLTNAISAMLWKSDDKISKEIMLAGKLGRDGMNQCQDIYPICKELEKDGVYSIPLLLNKNHPLYYDHMYKLTNKKL